MITMTWWLFVPLFLLAIVGVAVVAILAADSVTRREARVTRTRDLYVDWCRRNLWCPEHNIPDGNHSMIAPGEDGLLTVLPCPGSTTRHAVPWSGSRWLIREEMRREAERVHRRALDLSA